MRKNKSGFWKLLMPAIIGILVLPTISAKAGPGGNPPALHASFCGSRFSFESSDLAQYYFDNVDVFDTDGTLVSNFSVLGHNSETRDAGVTIGRIVARWGQPGYGVISELWVTSPTCGETALIDMYVYFSRTPFFGSTHTLTIYSAAGFPSKNAVTAFAGGSLPDGFAYGKPACWGMLYDDGTDQGSFACDAFLAPVGERRAWLRNDPQGSDFDMLPKIQAYLDMVK